MIVIYNLRFYDGENLIHNAINISRINFFLKLSSQHLT